MKYLPSIRQLLLVGCLFCLAHSSLNITSSTASATQSHTQTTVQELIARADRLFRDGYAEYQKGNIQESIEKLKQAADLYRQAEDNTEADVLAQIGLIYKQQKNTSQALEYYKRVIPLVQSDSSQGKRAAVLIEIEDGEKQCRSIASCSNRHQAQISVSILLGGICPDG